MGFNISRHLAPELVKLEMNTIPPEMPDNGNPTKWLFTLKEMLLSELLEVLDPLGKIGNRKKLLIDFLNRERKASTGIGSGFAIPHIRSMQAREFMIAFGRSRQGYDYGAIDGNPVNFFFIMAAPPYDDSLYLKVFKAISELVMFDGFTEQLMTAEEPYDVIKAIRALE
jgi:mannitol/fructose-specific phosphotransferase system IIA component (Ntr-type)